MTAPLDEYITDVPYVRCFVADLSPLTMRLVAALNGFPQPPGEAFEYCELGCGHGDTTATLAAAYPRGRFVGVDLNRDHIASGNALARGGELKNVRFLERDFEGLAAEALPDFDFMTAHGVLSWISPVKRKALQEFVGSKLKHGGLLYVGYNALPGWAAVEPLRQLMIDHGAAVGGTAMERAQAGVAFAKRLRDAGAKYFAFNPAANEMLETMERSGLSYVVHEYLHQHWVPMYFAQLAAEMAEHDLYFVGQLPLQLNYRDLAVPTSTRAIFEDVNERITFETLKDYATNQFFRRDIFVKGKVLRDEVAAHRFLDSTPFRMLPASHIAREVRLAHHTMHFTTPIFDALSAALVLGARTIPELAASPLLAGFEVPHVREAITRLCIAGQVDPTLARTRTPPAGTAAVGRPVIPSRYNRMILRDSLSPDHPIVLASTVAGTGFPFSLADGVALRLLTEVPEAEWAAWVARFIADQPMMTVRLSDRLVEGDDERARVLLAHAHAFVTRNLERLIELGILSRETQR